MSKENYKDLELFLDILGLDEEPMGVFYTDDKPGTGLSSKPQPLIDENIEEKVSRRKGVTS